jgi:hypothetical protein
LAGKSKHAVMLSSTYTELVEHRQAIQQAMLGQELFPLAMENDAALPDHDLISASLSKVDGADAYVGLISYRYGQAPEDADRNPEKLSLTELEFRRAIERGIPICMFIMSGEHQVPRSAVDSEGDLERKKLKAFVDLAKKGRIYAEFKSVDELKAKAVQSLVKLREAIEKRVPPVVPAVDPLKAEPKPLDVPPGWEIIDRDALAKIRANPPPLNAMVQFFDGILPTWRLALARGVQPRAVAERLANRFRAIHAGAAKPQVVLLAGAGGEGKSTAVLHTAAALVEDTQQAWTCLHRQAANAELPEDAFAKLPTRPDHTWLVVIDDADNIGPAILAAVKKIAARTDVHLLLAARDAEWQLKRLVPGMWQPIADFHTVSLVGLDQEDARRIVAGWVAWGDRAMGRLRGRSEGDAIAALLGHARDFAARKEDGELLGALLVTRQGDDMRAHVRTLVNGLGRSPVIKAYSLRDVYAMVAAMHAENQLYLSRSVLAFVAGSNINELDRKALDPLRREAMLDAGEHYVLTRHRRIAEAACTVMREDSYDVDSWYPRLAGAAQRDFTKNFTRDPDIAHWVTDLAEHFVSKGDRGWGIASEVAKAVWNAQPNNAFLLTTYSSVLRRTRRAGEAMSVLKASGECLRNDRAAIYEWSAVADVVGDHGLSAWLGGRSIADGGTPISSRQCAYSLTGLGAAFRKLFTRVGKRGIVVAQAACAQLGRRLQDLEATDRAYFEQHAADGRHNGIADLSPEQAIDAIRKAVNLGADEVEPANDPVFFEKLLGEPDGYRYTALLRMVGGTRATPAPQRTSDRPGRRK